MFYVSCILSEIITEILQKVHRYVTLWLRKVMELLNNLILNRREENITKSAQVNIKLFEMK